MVWVWLRDSFEKGCVSWASKCCADESNFFFVRPFIKRNPCPCAFSTTIIWSSRTVGKGELINSELKLYIYPTPRPKRCFFKFIKQMPWKRECLNGLSSSKCLLEELQGITSRYWPTWRSYQVFKNLCLQSMIFQLQHSNNSRWICRLFD